MKYQNWHVGNDGRNRTKTAEGTVTRQDYDSSNAPAGSVVVRLSDANGKSFTVWITSEQLAAAGYAGSRLINRI